MDFENINRGDVVGECRSGLDEDGNLLRKIRIDIKGWKEMNEFERHVLIFHELGHCHLGRTHDSRTGPIAPGGPNQPVSIMSPYVISGFLFQHFEPYYVRELFLGPY